MYSQILSMLYGDLRNKKSYPRLKILIFIHI